MGTSCEPARCLPLILNNSPDFQAFFCFGQDMAPPETPVEIEAGSLSFWAAHLPKQNRGRPQNL